MSFVIERVTNLPVVNHRADYLTRVSNFNNPLLRINIYLFRPNGRRFRYIKRIVIVVRFENRIAFCIPLKFSYNIYIYIVS